MLSTGERTGGPRHSKREAAALARAQRRLARRQKGPANREQSRREAARTTAGTGRRPLHVRTWTCTGGPVHDRDVNAAGNVLAAGPAVSVRADGRGLTHA